MPTLHHPLNKIERTTIVANRRVSACVNNIVRARTMVGITSLCDISCTIFILRIWEWPLYCDMSVEMSLALTISSSQYPARVCSNLESTFSNNRSPKLNMLWGPRRTIFLRVAGLMLVVAYLSPSFCYCYCSWIHHYGYHH